MTTQNTAPIITLPKFGNSPYESRHCMVDIETFGNGNDAVIAAIGAVAFTDTTPESDFGLFYIPVDPTSCTDIGMTIDANTVQWWLKQSEGARAAVCHENGLPITDALAKLSDWYTQSLCKTLWGNGATFDNVILNSAYRLAKAAGNKAKTPWHFREHRCYRTMRAFFPDCDKDIQNDLPHHALYDAIYQAKVLQRILAKLPKT